MRFLLPAAVALACAACEAAAPVPPEAPPGTRSLFDGRTLDGWRGDSRHWRVEGGAIVGESTEASPCTETTYLAWSGGEVADFELELEWRFPGTRPGANSGLQFRSLVRGPGDVVGYQADLETGPDWTGGLYEQGGRGVVARRGQLVVLESDREPRVERLADGEALLALVRPDDWNRLRVTALGPRLAVEVNGRLFSETIDLDPRHARRSGTFALQLHAGPPMRVEFRGLRLRVLGEPPMAAASESDALAPEWIWADVEVAERQVAWFRRRFRLAAVPVEAELWISGDNHVDAWLAGEGVATSDDWTRPLRSDVATSLVEGENELLVRVENREAQAGLVLTLTGRHADGSRFALRSESEGFEACLEPAGGLADDARGRWLDEEAPWGRARGLGVLGVSPWGALGSALASDGEAPESATISVPPGFAVERLLSVPLARQGSWVALTQDPRGRLYASDQYGGLFRITVPPAGASGSAQVEPVPVELGEAHGLAWAFDSLYAVVSGAGTYQSGLYRARDTDGDDVLDEVRCLRTFAGDGEHGPHGVVAHPDGRSLVVVGGNHTALPEPLERSRVPRHWDEDVLLPPLDDPGGHALGIRAPGGWVVRTDPEGQAFELIAVGLRNAYDLAFDAEGELFTFDSDMEWDLGLPWYRPTRILHLVSGADFGWRAGSAKWPADSFDSRPAAVDIGLASPTGLAFGRGTRFPPPWDGALFASDWAYGRIHAVFLQPEGASFRGSAQVFASGEPFPVTDLVVGLEGALYVTIGGRQAQSGLYRIAWVGDATTVHGQGEVGSAARSDPEGARLARAERRDLEGLHLGPLPAKEEARALERAFQALRSDDPALRHAARIALERRDAAGWEERLRAEPDTRARLEGWLALVRCDPEADPHEACEIALGVLAGKSAARERLDALRLLELVILRLDLRDGERARLRAALDPLYPSGDTRFDRSLLGLLVALEADVAARALAELERASTQEERVGILYALRALEAHWDTTDRSELVARWIADVARERESARGGASVQGYLERIEEEARARTGTVARVEAGAPVVPILAAQARAGIAARSWGLAELEPRLPELGGGRDFARGQEAYLRASCAECHRLAGAGQNRGPDLTGVAGRYSPRDLLRAILEPSREVPDVWRDQEFWGQERLLAVGRLEAEGAEELVVLETDGTRRRLAVPDVDERRAHVLSRMPEGLLAGATEEEILDLLAYVLAGGDAQDARFR